MTDTHCHLHHPGYFDDPDGEVVAAREAGVRRIIVVGVDPDDWPAAVAFAERHEGVWAILGWHPNACEAYDPTRLPLLIRLLAHPKVVGLGEIGLDRHHDFVPFTLQLQAFRDQLGIAEETGKPVVLHAREAIGDVLDVLERREPGRHPLRVLFHCFTGSADEARRALRYGALLGCDGPITYRNADELRRTFALVPPSRIVLETDAPYLAPVPHRGKPNRPAYVPLIAAALADGHGTTIEEIERVTDENATAFFAIGR